MAKDRITIQLKGVGGLDRKLQRMAITHQSTMTNQVFQAVNAGAKVVREEAQKQAPKDKHTIKEALKNRASRKNKSRHTFMAVVHFVFKRDKGKNTGDGGWYSHIVERGSKFRKGTNFVKKATRTADKAARRKISEQLLKKVVRIQQRILDGRL